MANETVDSELKRTQDEFEAAVRDMTANIKAQTAGMSAAEPVRPTVPSVDLSPDGLTKLANEKGVGAALQAVGQHVLAPMQNEAYELAVKTQRRVVERDAELGKWAKKHSKDVDAAIKADPARVANEGVDTIVRDLRDRDEEYRNERVEVEVVRRLAEEKAKLAPTAPPMPVTSRPPVDRPGLPVAAAPAAPSNLAADIAAVEINPDAFAIFQQLVPEGTEDDFRKERYAMDQDVKRLGAAGIRKAGGYPICTMDEIMAAGKRR